MATTMAAPVSNSIALAQRFLPLLDEVYKAESKTSILDTAEERVRWIGAKTVNLFNISPVGLSSYDRNAGFVPGDTNGGWEAYTLNIDRGRSLTVDVMDNDETLGLAFGSLLGEFERLEVIPEVDAYRLAKYCAGASLHGTPTTIISSTNVADMVDAGAAALDEAEVPADGRILFLSPAAYEQMKKNITRMVMNGDGNVNNQIEVYNNMRVIRVPQKRFYSAITLNAPTSSSGVGGYTAAGVELNFMIVHPTAILQTVKHLIPRIFSPELNQEADAWKLNYRIYHDAFVKDNKTNGIYFCTAVPSSALAVSASTASISGTGTSTVTVSNAQGAISVASSDEAVCTVSISGTTVTIQGVATGSATVTVSDHIGQTATVTVTVS